MSFKKGNTHGNRFKKGYTPWNKGKKATIEHRENIRKSLQGKKRPPFSDKWKENIGKAGKGKIREKAGGWKGGIKKHQLGYIMIYKPEHPHSGKYGYVMQHRLGMEAHLGRFLKPEEVVHHINENRSDNNIHNLMLFSSRGLHTAFHKKQEKL